MFLLNHPFLRHSLIGISFTKKKMSEISPVSQGVPPENASSGSISVQASLNAAATPAIAVVHSADAPKDMQHEEGDEWDENKYVTRETAKREWFLSAAQLASLPHIGGGYGGFGVGRFPAYFQVKVLNEKAAAEFGAGGLEKKRAARAKRSRNKMAKQKKRHVVSARTVMKVFFRNCFVCKDELLEHQPKPPSAPVPLKRSKNAPSISVYNDDIDDDEYVQEPEEEEEDALADLNRVLHTKSTDFLRLVILAAAEDGANIASLVGKSISKILQSHPETQHLYQAEVSAHEREAQKAAQVLEERKARNLAALEHRQFGVRNEGNEFEPSLFVEVAADEDNVRAFVGLGDFEGKISLQKDSDIFCSPIMLQGTLHRRHSDATMHCELSIEVRDDEKIFVVFDNREHGRAKIRIEGFAY